MARRASVGFTFYASDWLTSQRILSMTTEQEGAYIRLLAYAWEDENCSIPDDDLLLSSMTRLGKKWKRNREVILSCFEPHPERSGRLINRKLSENRVERDNFLKKQGEAGKLGANKRWGRHSNPIATENSDPIVSPMGSEKIPDSSPSPSPSPSPKKISVASATVPKQTWVTPFADAWLERYDGPMPIKPSLSALSGVRDALGQDEALLRWRRYLAATDGSYASAQRFAATIGEWSETGPRAGPRTVTGQSVQQFLAEGKR